MRTALNRINPNKSGDDYLGLNAGFWDTWKIEKKKNSSMYQNYLKPSISFYFRIRSTMKNNSLNYPCQSTAADMTKLACIAFYNWIKKNDLLFVVKIVNVVHDEICVECPMDLKKVVEEKLIDCMEKSGDVFSSIKMTADFESGFLWEH